MVVDNGIIHFCMHEQGAGSREQGAGSREQGAKGKGHGKGRDCQTRQLEGSCASKLSSLIRARGYAALTCVDGLEGLESIDLEPEACTARDADAGGPLEDPDAGARREHLGECMGCGKAAGSSPDDGHICTGACRRG